MSITTEKDTRPLVTSCYDWETGCVAPAILSDPLMAVSLIDLTANENAGPSIVRVPDDITAVEREKYIGWAKDYFKVLLVTQ